MNPEEESARPMPANPDQGTSPDAASSDVESTARPGAADVQSEIGRQLRAVYDDVVKQPIPDRFLALMKQLEEGAGQR